MSTEIRFLSYLSPSLPAELFEIVAQFVGQSLGVQVSLRFETRTSGPPRNEPDPFTLGDADVGFMCSPPFLWLCDLQPAPVELLPAAPVFLDPRAAGEPVYFSDVIVRREMPVSGFEGLGGRVWAYNDTCSLSGYYGMLRKLAELGSGGSFFSRVVRSGSHLRSIDAVLEGEADAAAIDSNVLLLRLRREPELRERMRCIDSWGPYPIQPVVVRCDLEAELKQALAGALRALGSDAAARSALAEYGLRGFAPPSGAYDDERELLSACEAIALGADA